MPHRASPIKLEDFASKAVALQILKAGCKIDNLPDRHDLSSHENNSIDNDRKPGELRYSVEKDLSPFHSVRASEMTLDLSNFLLQIPVTLLENVINNIEFGGDLDDDVLDRRLMTTIINLDKSRLSDLSFGLHAILCALTKTRIKKLNFNARCLLKAASFDEIGRMHLFGRTFQRCLVHFSHLTYCNLSDVANDSHLIALSDFCSKLEILKINHSEVTDDGIMHLAGYGKGLRRKLFDETSSRKSRRSGCFNLIYVEVERCESVTPKSVCALIKNCPKILDVRGPPIIDWLLSEFSNDISSYGSKTLRSFGKYPSKWISQWKTILDAFPKVKEVLIYDDKQLEHLHEMELTTLKMCLKAAPTDNLARFFTSRAGTYLTELVFRMSFDTDHHGGVPYTFKVLQMAQQHCKNLKILSVESIGKMTRRGNSEKMLRESPSGKLKFLECLSIQHISKSEIFNTDEEKFIMDMIASALSLKVLKLTGNFKKIDDDYLQKLCENNVFSNLREFKVNVPNLCLHKSCFKTLIKLPKIKNIWVYPAENSPEDVEEMLNEVNHNRYMVEIPGINVAVPSAWEISVYQNNFFYFI